MAYIYLGSEKSTQRFIRHTPLHKKVDYKHINIVNN